MEKKRILIVEDEAIVSMTIEDSLVNMGYEVIGTADNGHSAVKIAEKENPDLILMDIRLKGDLDGIETAERINDIMDIPIIFLTAHSGDDILKRAIMTGPYTFLIKPYRERELYSNIEAAFVRQKMYLEREKELQRLSADLQQDLPGESDRLE